MLKAIHAAEDRAAVLLTAHRVIKKLKEMRLAGAAEKIEESIEETLTKRFQFFLVHACLPRPLGHQCRQLHRIQYSLSSAS